MKYIRTKDGKIYKTLENYMQSDLPPTKIRVEDVVKGWHIIISKSKVIKQADNIKELFDEIVAVPHNLEKPMLGRIEVPASGGIDYPMFLNQKTGWYYDLYSFVGVYGAIWTDKGLIYVAKLNKSGRFELL